MLTWTVGFQSSFESTKIVNGSSWWWRQIPESRRRNWKWPVTKRCSDWRTSRMCRFGTV